MRMRRAAVFLLAVSSGVAACSGSEPPELSILQVGPTVEANVLPRLVLVADHPWTAIDPTLPDFDTITLEFAASGHGTTSSCTIEVRQNEVVRALDAELNDERCVAEWDGQLEGVPTRVGDVDVVASLIRGDESIDAHSSLDVLRVGIDEIQLLGDARVGLLYRAMDGVRYGYFEIGTELAPWRNQPDSTEVDATPIELADKTRRPHPDVWEDVTSPPVDAASPDGVEQDAYNLPIGWVSGNAVEGNVSWVVEGSAREALRVVSDSAQLGDVPIENGSLVDFVGDDWVPGVGRFDRELVLHLETQHNDEWIRLPGELRTTHRIYGLVATPEFDYEDSPHRPWVDVLDRIAEWLPEAGSADPDIVGAAIVEGVFYDFGLQYDNQRGASHYTSYPGGTWNGAAFNLSRFQEQADGNIINCSDAASIVSTYANMVGLNFRYHIIQHQSAGGFELNYLHAIGRDFGASPFVSGRPYFRYHAVVGPADTRIYDSTLALDGDGDPGAAPHELLLVQGLSEMDYLVGLSPEWDRVRVFVDDQVRIR